MRFTKAFQLIALALVLSMMQVYVMASPVKALTDPRTTDTSSSAKATSSEAAVADASVTNVASDSQLLTAKAAAERMPLTASSKTTLGRIFSKDHMEARLASANTFLKASGSFADTLKASSTRAARAQTSSDDSDSGGGGSRGTWIAVGVIAAVVTIAIIGLRHDRSHPTAATGL